MSQVNIHHAKTHLSRLLVAVERGERVVIARAGTPVAVLVPWEEEDGRRVLGRDRGLFRVPEDFDEPLAEEVLASFES